MGKTSLLRFLARFDGEGSPGAVHVGDPSWTATCHPSRSLRGSFGSLVWGLVPPWMAREISGEDDTKGQSGRLSRIV